MAFANGSHKLAAPALLVLAWMAARTAQRPGFNFLSGCRRWSTLPPSRSLTAAAAESATAGRENEPPAIAALQLPAANYFTAIAAGRCLEEGCSLAEAMDIYAKLRSDEVRLEEALQEEGQQKAVPATGGNGLQDSLLESRAVSNAFEAVFGFSDSDLKGNLFIGQGFPVAGLLDDHKSMSK